MRIALKVEVSSLQGAEEGVPGLLNLFETYQVKASFFFNTAISEKAGSLKRVLSKTRGLVTKPVPPEKRLESISQALLATIEAGHEAGLCAHDCVEWEKKAAFADADWTRHQLALASETFEKIVGYAPKIFAAANCQVNPHLLALEEKLGFLFASDTRGKHPFYPVLQNVRSGCPQIPVTLPTLEEMLAQDDVTPENVHEFLYAESRRVLPVGHVYTLNADQEGIEYLPLMEKLLIMWKGQEGTIRPMGDIYKELDLETLPRHQIGWGEVPGSQKQVAMQSIEVKE